MTDVADVKPKNEKSNESTKEIGGLRFDVFFTVGRGPTTEVYAKADDEWVKLFMFDEFIGMPHYHVPGTSKPVRFDRAALGQPHLWYLTQLRENLRTWIEISGYAKILPSVNLEEIAGRVEEIEAMMNDCFPADFYRDSELGVQQRAV